MSFFIASERLGKIGDPYTPKDGINIDALLAGGFIVRAEIEADEVEVSTTEEEKPAKTKPKKASKE
jgi:hypothetical protein